MAKSSNDSIFPIGKEGSLVHGPILAAKSISLDTISLDEGKVLVQKEGWRM
jgi:hypothetical protein